MSDEDEEISLDETLISTIVMNCLIIILFTIQKRIKNGNKNIE